MKTQLYEQNTVTVRKGLVHVASSEGEAVVLTPDAALQAAEELHLASIEARGQAMWIARKEAAARHEPDVWQQRAAG